MITIVADHRERASGVIECLEALDGVNVVVDTLSVGDYCVDAHLLVERKTLLDFAASIKDGRLFRQAQRLAASALQTAVVLEGADADLSESGMRREALQGAVISVGLIFGICVFRVLSPRETATLMVYAAHQVAAAGHGTLPRRGRRPQGRRRRQLYILQGLPGVGPDRASQLLARFGGVEAVMTASLRDLMAVPGIGKRTALAIRRAVERSVVGRRLQGGPRSAEMRVTSLGDATGVPGG
jgi:ERCC4-type nuclease